MRSSAMQEGNSCHGHQLGFEAEVANVARNPIEHIQIQW